MGRVVGSGGGGAGAVLGEEGRGQAGWETEGRSLCRLSPENLVLWTHGWSFPLSRCVDNVVREVFWSPRCTLTLILEKTRLAWNQASQSPGVTTPLLGATLDPP